MTGVAATLEAIPRPPSRGAGVGFAASLALHAIVLAGVVWWHFDAGADRAPAFVVEVAFIDAAPAADAGPASAPVAISAPPAAAEPALPEPAPPAVEQTRIEPPPLESPPPPEPIREAALPLPSPPRPRPAAAPKIAAPPQAAPSPPSPQLASAAPVSDAAEHAAVPAPASAGSEANAPASPAITVAPPGIAVVVTIPRFRERPVPPTYPRRALDLGQEGEVVVRALVGPDGESREIRLWRSSGVAALDDAALRAVRRWAFEAARVDGRPVEAWVEVPVRFQLRSVL